jgi:hypothetical protein
LLFDLHPVGNGVLAGFSSLDRSGEAYGAAVEQQFFRQRGFARIRVRYDREGFSSCDFIGDAIKIVNNSFSLLSLISSAFCAKNKKAKSSI